jgi:hypothetical protein
MTNVVLSTEQREKRDALEAQLEKLKEQKASVAEDEYLKQLEVIAVQLAEIYEAASK